MAVLRLRPTMNAQKLVLGSMMREECFVEIVEIVHGSECVTVDVPEDIYGAYSISMLG
jgi:hypothetical protein